MCNFNKVYLFVFTFLFPVSSIRLSSLNRICLRIQLSLMKVTKAGKGENVPLYNYLVSITSF